MKKGIAIWELDHRPYRNHKHMWLETLIVLSQAQGLFRRWRDTGPSPERAEPDDDIFRMVRVRLAISMHDFDPG